MPGRTFLFCPTEFTKMAFPYPDLSKGRLLKAISLDACVPSQIGELWFLIKKINEYIIFNIKTENMN